LPLAEDLAKRCQHAAAEAGIVTPGILPVSEESLDPSVIVDRPQQPVASTAVLEQTADYLTITLPAAGLIRGNNKFFLLWCTFWNGCLLIITPLSLPAAFAGKVKWDGTDNSVNPLFVCCFLTPVWIIGICCLLWLVYQARRRAAIRVAKDELTIEDVGIFSTGNHQWRRTDLASIAVVSKYTAGSDGEGGTWRTDLCIEPRSATAVHLFENRPKPELEWIATLLRWALQVPGAPAVKA
jgi:hypothetical protein